MISLLALAYAPPQQSRPAVRAPGARSRTPVLIAPDLAARVKEDGPGPLSSSDAASSPRKTSANEFVLNFPPRYPRLRDLSLSIRVRRTLEEAELALQLESEFNSDPSILNDIDFGSLQRRVERDMSSGNERLLRAGLLSAAEADDLRARQERAAAGLRLLVPQYAFAELEQSAGTVPEAVPKLRRLIAKARELPLTVELPTQQFVSEDGDVDWGTVAKESKNVAAAVRQTWQRLNGVNGTKEEELISLQRESKALLQLRGETVKLRAGIRLVQRQKELKQSLLVRSDGEDLLEQTLRADVSISRLQKELSIKAAVRAEAVPRAPPAADALPPPPPRARDSSPRLRLTPPPPLPLVQVLEMERIYLTVEGELSSSSALVDSLLPVVEQYGGMERRLRDFAALMQQNRPAAVVDSELEALEGDVADLLLRLGLVDAQAPPPRLPPAPPATAPRAHPASAASPQGEVESFSWSRWREQVSVVGEKAFKGGMFFVQGFRIMGEDVQLMVNILVRAVLQGNTLRQREVRLLRRIAKDLLTIIPCGVILIIPLTPVGHVLAFSLIQRLFPDFFPSAFTESRQNVMSMYSSITSRVPSYADESDGSYFGESGGFSDLEADGATAELPDNCGMDAEPEECAQSVLGGDGSDVA